MENLLLYCLLIVTLFHRTGANRHSVSSDNQLTELQSTHNQTSDQCSEHSQRFCFNSAAKAYNCSQISSLSPLLAFGIKCLESGPALAFGYCATYNEDTRVLSVLPQCGYFQYGVYNVAAPGYIHLPTVLTDLNEYMCGPLHRSGLVCSECADGYGPFPTSYWHRCAKCKGALYGVPLFLLVEFLPITVFYVVVVMFQVKLTSPPMPCFIMLAQFYTIGFEVLHWIGKTMPIFETEDGHIRLQDVKISHVFYSIFNLDNYYCGMDQRCYNSQQATITLLSL